MSPLCQSLNEFYPPPPQPRTSLTNDDLLAPPSRPDYKHMIGQMGGGSHELPSYEYFEENQNRFQISRSYGDIAQSHEKQGTWGSMELISSSRQV